MNILFQNGKKIIPDIRYKTLEEDNTYTLLIIETVCEDSGQYECVAINSAGEARCEAECIVQAATTTPVPKQSPSTISELSPTIVQPLTDQTVREGQPVIFKCKISGRPGNFYEYIIVIYDKLLTYVKCSIL